MKKCSKCKDEFSIENFYKDNRRLDKLTTWCKPCCDKKVKEWKDKNKERDKLNHQILYKNNKKEILDNCKIYRKNNLEKIKLSKRSSRLKKKYNLSTEEYNNLFIQQSGLCYICQNHSCKLHVDHDHTTGKVRALLCTNCNTALGSFKENINLLQKAIDYILKFNNKEINNESSRSTAKLGTR